MIERIVTEVPSQLVRGLDAQDSAGVIGHVDFEFAELRRGRLIQTFRIESGLARRTQHELIVGHEEGEEEKGGSLSPFTQLVAAIGLAAEAEERTRVRHAHALAHGNNDKKNAWPPG
jgi:hypothetical protein